MDFRWLEPLLRCANARRYPAGAPSLGAARFRARMVGLGQNVRAATNGRVGAQLASTSARPHRSRLGGSRHEHLSECRVRAADALVVDEGDRNEARVLESRREEVDSLLASVDERHIDVAEVMLRELTGKPLEANHRCRARRPQGGDDRVERALVPRVSSLLRATKQLLRRQVRLLGATPPPSGRTA